MAVTAEAPATRAAETAKPKWRPSAATTVLGIAVGLIVIVFAIFILLCVQGYATTVEQAKAKAQSAAAIVGDETGWIIGGAHTLLAQIAAVALIPADITDETKAAFDAARSSLPVPADLGIYDATGNAFGSLGTARLPESIADMDVFKSLEAGTDWVVSKQLADAATGAPVFVVAQRLGKADFGGVALLVIGDDVFEQLWMPQNLGAESTISVVRQDGWLVGRYPALPQTLDLGKSPPFTDQASVTAGTYESASSPADGVARIVAFERVPKLGLITFASVSRDAVLAGLWNSIITVTWLLVPIALALLVGSLITARLLKRSAQTQANLTAAVAHNEVLFREIHHRVKNNLQSVGSLLQMQPIPKEIKADMGQRIAAMSAVHEHIYRSSNFTTVKVKDYLETLIGNIRAGSSPRVDVVEDLDDLSVDKDAATPLGLIVNEVVSNAFKHAFPDGREGRIVVRLIRRGDGRGELTVEDNGVGYDPKVPAKGIGRRLIVALTQQLGGESSVASGAGSIFTLVFPLAK